MKKISGLLLAGVLTGLSASWLQISVKAESTDDAAGPASWLLEKPHSAACQNRNVQEKGISIFETDECPHSGFARTGSIGSEMAEVFLNRVMQYLTAAKETAGDAVEKVEVDPYFSKIRVFTDPASLVQADFDGFYQLAHEASHYRKIIELEDGQTTVFLEFVNRITGKVFNCLKVR